MEEQQDDVRAAEVLVADLEPRPGGRLLRGARLFGAVVAELAWGLFPGPSVSDVVVRRRDDGQWWVLDYKSAARPQDDPALLHKMRSYRAAVAAAYPGASVQAAFLTGQGRLVRVE